LLPVHIPIDDASRVAQARRVSATAALEEGLGDHAAAEAGIIATEAATNLLKHARQGEMHITRLSANGRPGVEILAIDRGPGVANIEQCLRDGYSTAGTPGSGLGAISRLATEFDVYSEPGKGTVLAARIQAPGPRSAFKFAAVCVPIRGEERCGDTWRARANGKSATLLVADGLGHGILAADASVAAAVVFEKHSHRAPAELLENVHLALKATRGAAVAIASFDLETMLIRYAGLGNIAGVILGSPRNQSMVSHNGTAGHQARRFQEFEYKLPSRGTLVMHSDGLVTSWNLDSYPGLVRRDPAVIAGVLYRDASRGRDDVCVVVARWEDR
jgi:anti-sigma regulatory factor (Ser/Thr protein kinase)